MKKIIVKDENNNSVVYNFNFLENRIGSLSGIQCQELAIFIYNKIRKSINKNFLKLSLIRNFLKFISKDTITDYHTNFES